MNKDLLRGNEVKKVTFAGILVNIILTIFKIYAGIVGKSQAIFADGIHSLSDFLTDIVVIVGFKYSEKKADADHNYGHGKYETLATVVISIFLFVVGFGLLKNGINNIHLIIDGESLEKPSIIALFAAFFSIVFKEAIYRYTIVVGKKINSQAVIANAWHHRSDALSSVGTLIGISFAFFLGKKWIVFDPLASVIVSFFIFKVATDILFPAINELLEKSISEDDKKIFDDILDNNQDIKGYHKLRSRKVGNNIIVEFHIFVDENMNIKKAHQISHLIEKSIKNKFGKETIVTIHIEPYGER
jgi:cation diffusion facilitator family transporter